MSQQSRLSLWLLSVLMLACSESTGSQPVLLQGTWLIDQIWTGDSLTCSFTAESLFVAQAGTVIRGQLRGGIGSCLVDSVSSGQLAQAADSISNAAISGTVLTFDVTQQLHYRGAVAGAHVTGTVTGALPFGPPANKTIALMGSWSATKQ